MLLTHNWQLIEHEGKVAAALPWSPSWTKPVDLRNILVSDIPIKRYAHLQDQYIQDVRGSIGTIYYMGSPIQVNMKHWHPTTQELPIKKPRKGKTYDWKWCQGRWIKTPL